MRVLVVTNGYPTAARPDVGTYVARQVESLRAAGVDVELVHLDRREHGRRTYRRLAGAVRKAVVEADPHLVHVMYGGVMADVVTRVVGTRPVLVSFCGADLLREGSNGLVDHLSWRYNLMASRRAATRAAGIVVKSRNLADAVPVRARTKPVWIVPNGVDLATFLPLDRRRAQERLGWDPERAHVLFPSSRDRPEKRFRLARRAVDLLNAAGHDLELHALARVPHGDVPLWLNAADVVVLTSRDEGSPNAVKEALACNVAVVSVDVGDVRERIEAIPGCYLAEAPSPRAVAAALARALEGSERIDGRKHVLDLALDVVAERLRGIYAELTGSKANAGGACAGVSSQP